MEGNVFNKNDYKILSTLLKNKCFSNIASYSIKQISQITELSIPKVRITLKNFILVGYVKIGAKDGISNTYYITFKGREFLKNITALQNSSLSQNNEEEKGEE